MAFTGPMQDRLAIRELYGNYADASSRGDAPDWLACWAQDCHWNSHIFNCAGKPALAEQFHAILGMFSSLAFMSEVGAIEVQGNQALGRSVAREIGRLTNGKLYKLAGRYADWMVRENGVWLYARRDYQIIVEEPPE